MPYEGRIEDVRDELRRLLETDVVYGVEVYSSKDDRVCEACEERDGKVYPLTEELVEDPPVPHEDCENEACRCVLLSVMDEDHPQLQ